MTRKKKKDDGDAGDALGAALDVIDELHAKIIALGTAAGLQADAENALVFDDGDDLPETSFEVAPEGEALPKGMSVALDTRLTLLLEEAQAEALVFQLLRAIREDRAEIAIELDGRWLLDRTAVGELRGALKRSSD